MEKISFLLNPDQIEKIKQLKVVELQQVLKRLGKSGSGTKHVLQTRLTDCFEQLLISQQRGESTEVQLNQAWSLVNDFLGNMGKRSRFRPASMHSDFPETSSLHLENDYMTEVPLQYNEGFLSNPFYCPLQTFVSVKFIKSLSHHFQMDTDVSPKEFIQVFCFPWKTLQIIHSWPVGCEVTINQRSLSCDKLKGHKGLPDQVANITPWCKSGKNTITVNCATSIPYLIVVKRMNHLTIQDLISTVSSHNRLNYQEASARVISSFNTSGKDDLQQVSSRISLIDPLSRSLITIPSRATTCKHIQCFDLRSYLQFNERTPKWNCPVCSKKALFKDLIVDEYFEKILQDISTEATEVEIEPGGNWTIPIKTVVKKEPREVSIIELSDDEEEIQEPTKKPKVSEDASTNLEGNPSLTFQPPKPCCYICGKLEIKQCSRCKRINYCGVQCQTKDWNRHRNECKESSAYIKNAHPHWHENVIVLSDTDS